MRALGLPGEARRWLDVGAGDGWLSRSLLRALAPGASLTCVDAHFTGAQRAALSARHGAVRFLREVPEEPFDLLLLLDVAEHVVDDEALLRTLRSRLAPGGWLLFTVPAWPALFSQHDVRLQHHRRYTPAGALQLLERAGFRTVEQGGLFPSLLAPRALALARERLLPSTSTEAPATGHDLARWKAGAVATRCVDALLEGDLRLTSWALQRGLPLPGLSFWAAARLQG